LARSSCSFLIELQHFDFRNDLLDVKVAGQFDLSADKPERLGEARLLLRQDIDVPVELVLPCIEDVALGLHRLRRDPDKLLSEFRLAAALYFGFQARDARGNRGATLPHFAKLGGETRVVDFHQDLALLHDRAFVHQDLADDAAFKALQQLGLPRRHNAPVAALDFIQLRKVGPGQTRRHQCNDRYKKNPRSARRAKLRGGTDVVEKCQIRRPHSLSPMRAVGTPGSFRRPGDAR
jgi:hypothetical protein